MANFIETTDAAGIVDGVRPVTPDFRIDVGDTFQGTLVDFRDSDFVAVEMEAGYDYVFTLSPTADSGNRGMYLVVFDSRKDDLNSEAYNYAEDLEPIRQIFSVNPVRISGTYREEGEYHLDVRGNFSFEGSGGYTLQMDREIGGNRFTETTVEIGTVFESSLDYPEVEGQFSYSAPDIDVVAFTLDAGVTYTISLTGVNMVLTIEDDLSSRQFVTDDSTGDGVAQVMFTPTKTDRYLAQINGVSTQDIGDYSLLIEVPPLELNGDDTSEELLGGSGNDLINGNGGDDTLTGDAGNDTLDGGIGADSMAGGAGNDSYFVDEVGDVVLEAPDSGNDTVTSSIDYALTDNVEVLILSGMDDIAGTGNALANSVMGNDGANTLYGGAGDDTLSGGTGADLLVGGQGSDEIHVDDAGDRVAESRKWAGTDTVISSVDFRTGNRHIENVTLTGDARIGAGNGLQNVIIGNDGDNILDGGKNNDTLIGGLGDDIYLLRAPGDTAVEKFGEGIDVAKSYGSFALMAHVEKLFMQTVFSKDGTPVNFNGIGNGLDNTIIGTPFDNTIVGREGSDTLKGQAGSDTFVFDRAVGDDNVDRIVDFNTNTADEGDILKLKGTEFGGLSAGALAASSFAAGTMAADADDRIVFDQVSGQLWFDADGSGAAAQILIATFDQNALVTAADIEVF